MNIKKHKSLIILFLIFLFSVVFRLFFTLKTQYFDMYSYDSFRQIISITETGFPLIVDSLSFGGRVLISSPVYYYIIAGFSFVFGKVFALKVLPAIFISLTTFLVYLLAKRLTDNENVSLLAAFFSAFFPALFIETFNSLSPINLVIPVILGCSYLFINLRKSDNPYGYVFLLFLLALLSPLSTIFVLGIIIFLIIL